MYKFIDLQSVGSFIITSHLDMMNHVNDNVTKNTTDKLETEGISAPQAEEVNGFSPDGDMLFLFSYLLTLGLEMTDNNFSDFALLGLARSACHEWQLGVFGALRVCMILETVVCPNCPGKEECLIIQYSALTTTIKI
ncbi:hypothetical protein T11_5429 [Trichinella zimbabwensis]|uniref:Uncharacterized protein n=1 Tax=Trichinella zimbabwensis TaxID=268475 RepID=A0A0V1GZC2_9BILA|nr:hypothetical protein T11_12748 [Trichinella zimbabwensis]KRZ01979.1 hypothetical protein T11_15366 [Trichinella zimbabwensis]KRZ03386.1 hypothetical protein T11_2469 [Trichinella zimbabwensis]KRZ04191.1 hypothetical protein T11_11392 [Trichinella zimbabwensis]KRZ04194.1 hypothetical protein T11_5429 [Trichinella zimbabwensis]